MVDIRTETNTGLFNEVLPKLRLGASSLVTTSPLGTPASNSASSRNKVVGKIALAWAGAGAMMTAWTGGPLSLLTPWGVGHVLFGPLSLLLSGALGIAKFGVTVTVVGAIGYGIYRMLSSKD